MVALTGNARRWHLQSQPSLYECSKNAFDSYQEHCARCAKWQQMACKYKGVMSAQMWHLVADRQLRQRLHSLSVRSYVPYLQAADEFCHQPSAARAQTLFWI